MNPLVPEKVTAHTTTHTAVRTASNLTVDCNEPECIGFFVAC